MSARDYSDLIAHLAGLTRYEHSDITIGDEAADAIEQLQADATRLRDLLRECRLALIWSADEANDAFLARLDAAIGDDK